MTNPIEAKPMPFTVEIKLVITNKTREYPYTGELANVEQKKTITCHASEVRAEATKLLRQAVANFSESAISGLAPIIAEEPKIAGKPEEDKALEI